MLISESASWMVSAQRGSLSLWIPCAIICAGVQNSSDTVTKMSCTYCPKIWHSSRLLLIFPSPNFTEVNRNVSTDYMSSGTDCTCLQLSEGSA